MNNREVWPTEKTVYLQFCWIFNQKFYVGPTKGNPKRGLLLLDHVLLDCIAKDAPGTHSLL
ncbi:unnamed protein product [Oikopleura dioica]|uniref:Uncharacterized protein n=1 Tax=Oikopleura dioica TaxID=34765 RepID=E4WZ62_OIKDI|nr:unnamed protein product [Oikopleura dioica]